jgi:hypothetical protein
MRALTAADDNLHQPTSDDIFWTETAWFAFSIPERSLTGFIYPVFRTNQKICSAGVFIWDHAREAAHEILYSQNYWHIPLPNDLTRMNLLTGLSYEVIEPLHKYRVRYDGDGVSFNLIYEGLIQPQLTKKEDHLDQPCHVQGVFNFHGIEYPVNCYEMRDKSWHVRSDLKPGLAADLTEGSYTYASDGKTAFLAKTYGADKNETMVHSGWLLRDGRVSSLVSGKRMVVRETDRPPGTLIVHGTDELDRTFSAKGVTVNRFPFQSTPAILAWICGTKWDIDGQPAWGEDQEWSVIAKVKQLVDT